MGTVTLKKQSAASVPLPATDEHKVFVDSVDNILKTKDSSGVVRSANTNSHLINTTVKVGAGSYSAVVNDFVRVDVAAGILTVNLPVGHLPNDEIGVKVIGLATFSCVIDANGAELIDGATTLVLSTNYEWAILRSDGTNWMQVG